LKAREVSVFLNCPFDKAYSRLFQAIVFTIHDCGYIARSSLEMNDTAQIRVSKIMHIISECHLGIHDLSRTQLDKNSRLPRFNMPLELGMFLAAKEFGGPEQRRKRCLVLDTHPHRYQQFCSDIAGQDISAHSGSVELAIKVVRDFLSTSPLGPITPGGSSIHGRFISFQKEFPSICEKVKLHKDEATFNDFTNLVTEWLANNP
jgi:hypothetical protein